MAYDEHGIFFVYSMKECEKLLQNLGLENTVRELITSKAHWAVRIRNSENRLEQFKKALKSKSVFYNDEAEPVNSADAKGGAAD